MSNDQQLPASPLSSSLAAAQQTTKKYTNVPKKNCETWYLDTSTTDVYFTFDSIGNHTASSSTRLGANKTILAMNSDVFKAMFYGELKESGDIHVTDASSTAFHEFLQFFYLNEVELKFEHIADVMHLGHKYMITNCIDVCIQFLKDSHTADNTIFILGLAMLYDHTELVKLCKQFIILNTSAVLRSNGFLECDRQILGHILNANLFICSEIELFEACMAWVKAKSGHAVVPKDTVDEHLGNLFYDFRFGTLTIQEFCDLAKKYDAVLSNDYKAITELIVLPHQQHHHHHRFNTCPRKIKWNENGAVAVRGENRADIVKAFCFEYIKISSNKPLLLTGFTCSPLQSFSKCTDDDFFSSSNDDNNPSGISVRVKIREEVGQHDVRDNRNLLKTSAKLGYFDADVTLPRPILIKPGLYYQISIRYPYQFTYYSKAINKTAQLPSDTTIEFHDNKLDNAGEKIVGLFSAIKFIRV